MSNAAVCLMGPTAAGKTDVAIALCERFPFDIVSVDSALVYRGMNIGTAKPDAETLRRAPHRLVDIREPEEKYSAGDFVRDARREIEDISANGRIPLLVGGTMMYFRALTGGIAKLPPADEAVRRDIDAAAAKSGWPAMHSRLRKFDPVAARRISENDSQRIQRALEVHAVSGRNLSDWLAEAAAQQALPGTAFIKIALQIPDRKVLHQRIAARLEIMFANGFVAEVENLMRRPGLKREMPSMRSVGYRQVWAHLAGECSLEDARYRALVATRQLAKRQITWLRSETDLFSTDPLEARAGDAISAYLDGHRQIFEP